MFPIFSVIAGAGTALANGLATRKSNRINQKNYEDLRAYNSPRSQMARFKGAGLNPHLIYTQTNEMSPAPDWRAPQFDFNQVASNATSEISAYQNIKESKSRVSNLVKQNDLLDKQIDLTLSQKGLTDTQINQVNKTIDKIEAEIQNMKFDQNYRSYQQLLDTIYRNSQLKIELDKLGLSREQLQEQIREFEIQHQLQSVIYDLTSPFRDEAPLSVIQFFKESFLNLIDTSKLGAGSYIDLKPSGSSGGSF